MFLTGVSGETLVEIASNCKDLHSLNIHYANPEIVLHLPLYAQLASLTAINLSTTKATDEVLVELSKHCKKLVKVNLYDTKVSESGVNTLIKACVHITELNLGNIATTAATITLIGEKLKSRLFIEFGSLRSLTGELSNFEKVVEYLIKNTKVSCIGYNSSTGYKAEHAVKFMDVEFRSVKEN